MSPYAWHALSRPERARPVAADAPSLMPAPASVLAEEAGKRATRLFGCLDKLSVEHAKMWTGPVIRLHVQKVQYVVARK